MSLNLNTECIFDDKVDDMFRDSWDMLSDTLGMIPVPVGIQKDWTEFRGSLDDFLNLIVKSDGESKFFYYDTISRDVFVQQYRFISDDEIVVNDSDLNKVDSFSIYVMLGGLMVGICVLSEFSRNLVNKIDSLMIDGDQTEH